MRDLEAVLLQLKLLAGARNPSATGESMRPNEARPLTPLTISPENKKRIGTVRMWLGRWGVWAGLVLPFAGFG
jgi:hypothetical protein